MFQKTTDHQLTYEKILRVEAAFEGRIVVETTKETTCNAVETASKVAV